MTSPLVIRLKTYTIEADYHQQNPGVKRFGYYDGGQHAYDPQIDAGLVFIGINSLVHDFGGAVQRFVQAMIADIPLHERVAAHIPQIVQLFPFNLGDHA